MMLGECEILWGPCHMYTYPCLSLAIATSDTFLGIYFIYVRGIGRKMSIEVFAVASFASILQ